MKYVLSNFRKLASDALQKLKEEGGKDLTNNVQINMDSVKVVPKVVPTDPCCESAAELGIQLVEEFTYVLDFTVVSCHPKSAEGSQLHYWSFQNVFAMDLGHFQHSNTE